MKNCIWYSGYEPECFNCGLNLDDHIIPYTIQILVIDKWLDYGSGTKDEVINTVNNYIVNNLVIKSNIRIKFGNSSKLKLMKL